MSAPTALIPGQPVPQLPLKFLDGTETDLAASLGKNFTLLVFYRGYHCPKCKDQLLELQAAKADFEALGTNVIAVSMDPQERAVSSRDEWQLPELPLAHGMTIDQARAWGLHMSTSRGKTSTGVEELKIFNEPGLFLIRNDGTLYASWVQTVPFCRPKTAEIVASIGFIQDKNYPPRGTLSEFAA